MKIKNTFRFKFMLFLLVCFLLPASCTKDEEAPPIEGEAPLNQANYQESPITFEEFRLAFDQQSLQDHFSSILESGFILNINTNSMITFASEESTQYLFDVETANEDRNSFTKLMYNKDKGDIKYSLLRYTPDISIENSKEKALANEFSGSIALLDENGEVLVSTQSNELMVKDPVILNRGTIPCIITVEGIIEPCYGPTCPCLDGNGMLTGWTINLTGCTNPPGGTSGTNPNSGNPNGGGGGGGGGNTNNGNLPTTAAEWDVFMGLNSITGPNDYFYLDSTINPNEAVEFNNINEFLQFYNNKELVSFSPIDNQDGTHSTQCQIQLGIPYVMPLNINIFIQQNLRTTSPFREYSLVSLTTTYTGITFASNWTLDSFSSRIEGNTSIIDVYGYIDYNLIIDNVGAVLSDHKNYRIEINVYTGEVISLIEIEN